MGFKNTAGAVKHQAVAFRSGSDQSIYYQCLFDGYEKGTAAGTLYEKGVFRMKLILPRDFPHSPPKGYFLTKIFHPNIANNGEICVNTLKKDWSPSLGLCHVLLVVRCLLIESFPESALNEQAGKMLLEDYEEYGRLARLYTGMHAKPPKAKLKQGAMSESSPLNVDQTNTPSQNINPKKPSNSGVPVSTVASSTKGIGGSKLLPPSQKKEGLLTKAQVVDKKKIDGRKKSLKRL